MTPEEARRAIRDAEALRSNLPADCWRALETVAGMREEWGIVAVYLGRHEVENWGFDTRDDAVEEALALDLDEFRIVPRYVTEPEEIK